MNGLVLHVCYKTYQDSVLPKNLAFPNTLKYARQKLLNR